MFPRLCCREARLWTLDGLEVKALNDGGKIIEDIGSRVLGRVTAKISG